MINRRIGNPVLWMGFAFGCGLLWAVPADADVPVPPGPGVTIDVAGVEEPSTPDPDTNCTGTDPVTCATLREAIMFANSNTAEDGTQTKDTIVLPAGTYSLTIEGLDETFEPGQGPMDEPTVLNEPDAAIGDLDITESVNIVGAGSATTIIDAGWVPVPWDVMTVGFDPKVDPVTTTPGFGDRVFHVVSEPLAPGASVAIDVQMSGLTIKGGQLTTVAGLTAPNATEYSLRRSGGGIGTSIAAGTYDPLAASGGGSGGKGAPPADPGGEEGGATYSLALTDVVVTSNYAGDGGGLYNAAVSTLTTSTISNNRGNANGGGVFR